MKQFVKKQWSNIIFVILIILLLNPSSKEWFIKTISFSPSLDSKVVAVQNASWELKGLNTDNINLADFSGKVVFVNFWATWCPPCRAEMPAIQNLYDAYKNEVVFLFVTNESLVKVEPFLKKYNYDLPVYNSLTRIPLELNTTNSIPATYIINKKGDIVLNKTGAANWDSSKSFQMIDALLSE
ncbi:TlpA disulfide reductase family protein [Flavicella sp.]|uniref:TlpA family protein disulfide reductase n=1 Tax=Flavicella sp. TaxID=2957742 RepID=UPI00261D2055|nr:TlpA disulfide reductase family protein [Flavicella sp.]MDG1803614.1 TlpA disulfide reductase family protein [Flavicella sp.]